MNKQILAIGLVLLLTACGATTVAPVDDQPRPASENDLGDPRLTFTPLVSPSVLAADGPTPGVGTPSEPRPRAESTTVVITEIASGATEQTVPQLASTISATTALPRIFAFGLEPPEVEPGGRVYLSWDAHGDRAYICPRTFLGSIDHLCFDVTLKGQQYVTIFADEQAWDYRGFELHVWQNGIEEVAFLPLRIACQGGGQWWFFKGDPFTTNIPANCPINQASLSDGAAQRFEHGMMLWIKEVGQVIVLYDDGHYERYSDLDCAPDDGAASPTPPPGRYVPIRGFGNLWHGYCPGTDHIQQTLGWGIAPEFFIATAYQCYESTDGLTCFVRGPEVQIYRVRPDGTWDIWPAH